MDSFETTKRKAGANQLSLSTQVTLLCVWKSCCDCCCGLVTINSLFVTIFSLSLNFAEMGIAELFFAEMGIAELFFAELGRR